MDRLPVTLSHMVMAGRIRRLCVDDSVHQRRQMTGSLSVRQISRCDSTGHLWRTSVRHSCIVVRTPRVNVTRPNGRLIPFGVYVTKHGFDASDVTGILDAGDLRFSSTRLQKEAFVKGIEDFCALRRLAAVESSSVNCSCRNRRTPFEVDATVASTSHLFTVCTTSTAFCNKRHVASKRNQPSSLWHLRSRTLSAR